MRTAARADDNQAEIVEALRAEGCYVVNIRWPVDLLVGVPSAGWLAVEVKDGSKPTSARKLTEVQLAFIGSAPPGCPTAVVTDVESALRAVRAMCNSAK
jgi:hypothetical protein